MRKTERGGKVSKCGGRRESDAASGRGGLSGIRNEHGGPPVLFTVL